MTTPRNDRPQPEAPFGELPFQGWAWRGADLTDRPLALFLPGRVVQHLGPASLKVGKPTAWPVHFAVRVHQGWRRGRQVALPADARFTVWAVLPLPGGGPCVVLEQLAEEACSPPAFQRSLALFLKRWKGPLAPPQEAERRAWSEPFAQWLPESKLGDPPVDGPLYDFEDAVRYASAWSGLEEGLTWRALAALERYLELAGIAQVEEDDDLLREREAARAWLPDRPGTVDERSEGYAAWSTGLDPLTVAAAGRGELAYLDHLGLITWDDEGEREERLGAPAWPLAGARMPRL